MERVKLLEINKIKEEMPNFDVILTNTPFHDSKTNKKGNKWSKFVLKMFPILPESGFLSFINPPPWMSNTDINGNNNKKQLYEIYSTYDMLYLNLDIKKYFKQGSQFSGYILQKSKTNNIQTIVISNNETSYLDLKNFNVLPTTLNKYTLSIINKVFFSKPSHPFSSKGCVGYPKPINVCKYKIYNSGGKFGSAEVIPKNANIKKVVVSVSGNMHPLYDKGEYGLSINSYWCPVKNEKEGKIYIHSLNSKFFKELFRICKYSGFHNLFLLKNFPLINKIMSLNEIYKYFNLSDEEIYYLENCLYPKKTNIINQSTKEYSLYDSKLNNLRISRRKETAEDFTPLELVDLILNNFPNTVWEPNINFLDPTAGNGNFLIQVLQRKLLNGHNPLQAISTIYGVELMADNVEEMKERLLSLIPVKFYKKAEEIVNNNIVCHNSLMWDFDNWKSA